MYEEARHIIFLNTKELIETLLSSTLLIKYFRIFKDRNKEEISL